MAAYDAFYRRLVAIGPLRNVVSRFAIERIKATTALPFPARAAQAVRSSRIAQAAEI